MTDASEISDMSVAVEMNEAVVSLEIYDVAVASESINMSPGLKPR